MHSPEKFPLHFAGLEPCKSPLSEEESRQLHLADAVSAVIAMENSQPLRPQAKTLEAIHRAISHHQPKSIWQMLYASSGWAAAVAMAMLFFLQQKKTGSMPHYLAEQTSAPSTAESKPDENGGHSPLPDQEIVSADSSSPILQSDATLVPANPETSITPESSEGQRKLIQEMETLREKVAVLSSRDSVRMAMKPGVSWPVIMKLTSPNVNAAAVVVQNPLLSAFLEPERAVVRMKEEDTASPQLTDVAEVTPDPTLASAIPVYDPARDLGQIMLNNVGAIEEGQSMNLWVLYEGAATPQQVGTFPSGIKNGETISFQLGSKGMIPRDFIITQDSHNAITQPNESNILLSSPQP